MIVIISLSKTKNSQFINAIEKLQAAIKDRSEDALIQILDQSLQGLDSEDLTQSASNEDKIDD